MLKNWLSLARKSAVLIVLERLEQALQSLRARGIVDRFERSGADHLRLQWARGNFGLALTVSGKRPASLEAVPICNPAGPFADDVLGDEVLPIKEWRTCGPAQSLSKADRLAHVALIEMLLALENTHPAMDWLAEQFRRMARGEQPGAGELQGIVLLGGRRYVKTIPASDRLHEAMEPALATLLRMNRTSSAENSELDVFAGEDYGRALLEFLQESHPLAATRAARKFAMTC